LFPHIVDLLVFVHQAVSDDGQRDVSQLVAATHMYDKLAHEVSQLVMGKLETGNEVVVSRLGTFLLCLTGKSNSKLDKNSAAEKKVKFASEGFDEAASSTMGHFADSVAGVEGLTINEETASLLMETDLLQGDDSPMWHLICDSCWLSLQLADRQSSCVHFQFLAVILCSYASDRLFARLLKQAELPLIIGTSVCGNFVKQMILPIVDHFKFHKVEGSQHILSILMSLYGRLRSDEQVSVVREIASRSIHNLIYANFLSEVISSKERSEELRCWLHGDKFGKFIVQLTADVCQRRLAMIQTEEVLDKPIVNDQSMDDSHWKVLCACLAVDQKSGLSFLTELFVFLIILVCISFTCRHTVRF